MRWPSRRHAHRSHRTGRGRPCSSCSRRSLARPRISRALPCGRRHGAGEQRSRGPQPGRRPHSGVSPAGLRPLRRTTPGAARVRSEPVPPPTVAFLAATASPLALLSCLSSFFAPTTAPANLSRVLAARRACQACSSVSPRSREPDPRAVRGMPRHSSRGPLGAAEAGLIRIDEAVGFRHPSCAHSSTRMRLPPTAAPHALAPALRPRSIVTGVCTSPRPQTGRERSCRPARRRPSRATRVRSPRPVRWSGPRLSPASGARRLYRASGGVWAGDAALPSARGATLPLADDLCTRTCVRSVDRTVASRTCRKDLPQALEVEASTCTTPDAPPGRQAGWTPSTPPARRARPGLEAGRGARLLGPSNTRRGGRVPLAGERGRAIASSGSSCFQPGHPCGLRTTPCPSNGTTSSKRRWPDDSRGRAAETCCGRLGLHRAPRLVSWLIRRCGGAAERSPRRGDQDACARGCARLRSPPSMPGAVRPTPVGASARASPFHRGAPVPGGFAHRACPLALGGRPETPFSSWSRSPPLGATPWSGRA
jgi:hypothetical protein